jgi:hypothetical protein
VDRNFMGIIKEHHHQRACKDEKDSNSSWHDCSFRERHSNDLCMEIKDGYLCAFAKELLCSLQTFSISTLKVKVWVTQSLEN